MSHASLIVALSPEQIEEHSYIYNAIMWNMEPFNENGEWFREGSRWDWWHIGGQYTAKFEPDYDPEKDPVNWADGEVKWPSKWVDHGNVVLRREAEHLTDKLTAFAFLKDRRWHESGRLGHFGCVTATECEIKAEEQGKEFTGRCIHKCGETGSQIISWNESEDGHWDGLFWARFIRQLPAETTLVCVDYHI